MNIQNRISSIEKSMSRNFCNCKGTRREEMFLQDLTSDTETTAKVLLGEAVPDTCQSCGKSIDKDTLTIILQD